MCVVYDIVVGVVGVRVVAAVAATAHVFGVGVGGSTTAQLDLEGVGGGLDLVVGVEGGDGVSTCAGGGVSNGGSGDAASVQYELPFCIYADGIAYELSSIR